MLSMVKKHYLALTGCIAVIVLCLFASSSLYAASTIYRCKLLDGRYQYQQEACSDEQVSGNTAAHKSWRAMRKLSVNGQKILQRLGPDVESIKQCKTDMRKFQAKLNDVNKMLKRVKESEQPLLYKSYSYLQDCAECRTSATSACQLAGRYLDEAMAKLMQVN